MEKGGRRSGWIFVRVDAARDVGQRHVVGVMRRDTFARGAAPSVVVAAGEALPTGRRHGG